MRSCFVLDPSERANKVLNCLIMCDVSCIYSILSCSYLRIVIPWQMCMSARPEVYGIQFPSAILGTVDSKYMGAAAILALRLSKVIIIDICEGYWAIFNFVLTEFMFNDVFPSQNSLKGYDVIFFLRKQTRFCCKCRDCVYMVLSLFWFALYMVYINKHQFFRLVQGGPLIHGVALSTAIYGTYIYHRYWLKRILFVWHRLQAANHSHSGPMLRISLSNVL